MGLDYLVVPSNYLDKRISGREEVSGGYERGFWVGVGMLAIEVQKSSLGGRD